MKPFVGIVSFLTVGALSVTPPVYADPVTYSIDPGQTFSDGASVTGTFTFDALTDTFVAFDFFVGSAPDLPYPISEPVEFSSISPNSIILNNLIGDLQVDLLYPQVALEANVADIATTGETIQFLSLVETANCYPGCSTSNLFQTSVIQEPVPEPASVLLLASGLAGLAVWRRKKAGQRK